jgi:general secretion pathway protein D
MPGKCFRGLVTLAYVTSSVLPLAAQQGPTQPPLTPVPVQPAPTEPNQAAPGQGQPSPSQLPRRAPAVPQRPPSPAQQVPGAAAPSEGTVPQGVPAPAPGPVPTPIPPERRLLPPPSTAGGMVSLNFNRADLVEIIHILAQHLRLTYTIDPEVKGVVTIHSAEPLRPEDLLPIFHQVLRMNNAVAVRTGNIYRITTIKDAKGLVRPAAQGREDSFALQVVPVRFFSAAEMKKLLSPFLTPGGELIDYPRGNFLVIIDLPSNIQRLVEIADMIDVQVFAGTRMEIYQPKVASAEELATEMTKVMQYYAASAPQQESFASQFLPLPRINQLLVISHSEAAWTYARRWLERVDVAGEGPGRRIFIYPVENGKATELADVLSQALGQPITGRRDTAKTLQDLHRSTPGGMGQFGSSGRSSTSSFGGSGFQQQSQPLGSAFATVPVPAQVPPAVPAPGVAPAPGVTPGLPSVPGAPRPATPAAPGAKPEEQLRIVPDPGTNSLIIYGTVQEFQNIKNILKELDIIPRQVLMDVMVAEVSLTGSEAFGVEYELFRKYNPSIFGQTFDSQGAVRSGIFNQATRPATEGSPFAQFLNGISGVAGRGNTIRAFISALATDNRAKILSSPSVLATDNRPARIQVGREIPVLSSQSQSTVGDSPIVNSVQYRNTGVILTIIPQVNSQGLVHLQVKQEVSDVGAPSFGNTNSPSFTTRDAETTAVVQDGDTLAIGGIISDTTRRDRSGVPYLMDLPVLGRLFGTTNDTTDRTELVMLITPHVVRNRDEAQVVTEAFKDKVYGVRNELERFRLEQERLQLRRQPPTVPDQAPPVPGATRSLPGIPPNTSSVPRDVAPSVPGQALPQHMPQTPAPPQPSISLDKRGRKNASSVETASATVTPNLPADVPVITELTNRNPPLPWPPSAHGSPAEIVPPVEPTQVAQLPQQSEGIPSALSVRSIDPVAQSERAAPAKPALGHPVPPAHRVITIAKKSDRITNGPDMNHIWMVQVAPMPQEEDADQMADRLRQKGYDARVIRAEVDNRLRYRVRVGQLTTRNDAVELNNTLKANEKFADSYISRVSVR